TARADHNLLGLDRFKRCFTRPKAHAGNEFAVVGTVDEYMGLPPPVSKVLKAKDGARFRVWRDVAQGLRFYATVFARTAKHADRMLAHLDDGKAVALQVRVIHVPPKGGWRGFLWFEHPPKSRDFALVIEEFLSAGEVLKEVP